ncbi:MAG TPA: gamma-glutamyltransferase, partial [Nevskiaceae bacterium]|nr:gamma-glutamyltransferase [Nevskiaceae bacterium]
MKKLLALTLCWSALICGLVFVSASAEAGDMPPGYAVASAHPLATQAGLDILAAGGNAFDAAVAVSAALGVVEPTGSGLGGGGFFLLHRASDGLDTFVDGRETAPRKATANMYLDASGKADAQRSLVGMLASAIPAQPALLDYVARKYGSKPLADDLAPAIRYA